VALQSLGPVDDLALYSISTSPLGMGATANTPLPCTPERLTWMRRPFVFGADTFLERGVLAAPACVIDLFMYIEFVGARAYVCMRARSPDCIDANVRRCSRMQKEP
jgi:hypothetical protein